MAEYLIYFNQQWVGDHSEEWFISRGATSMAVADEMKEAGVWVFGGGLEEEVDDASQRRRDQRHADFTDGPFAETKEHLGGFCVIRRARRRDRQDVGGQGGGGLRLAAGGPPLQVGAADDVSVRQPAPAAAEVVRVAAADCTA